MTAGDMTLANSFFVQDVQKVTVNKQTTKFYIFLTYSSQHLAPEDGETVILEPWRRFEMMDSGVKKDDGEFSVVPLKMCDEGLVYEKEIPPGVLLHVVKVLKERTEDKTLVKNELDILLALPFNNKCT